VTWLYVTDRYHRMPRVLRIGINARGVETAPRLQFWDTRRERMADPCELALTPDRRRLLVTDSGSQS
jgi:hypothetical protein